MEQRLSFSYQSVVFVPFIYMAFLSLWPIHKEKESNSALFSDLVHAKFCINSKGLSAVAKRSNSSPLHPQ